MEVQIHVLVYHENVMIDDIPAVKKDDQYEYSLVNQFYHSYLQSLPPNTYSIRYSAPHSSYLFHPTFYSLTVIPARCQDMIPTVTVTEGRVVRGQIIPPLAGVTVRMTVTDNGKMKIVEAISDEKGEYSFTPISQDAEIISYYCHSNNLLHFTLLKQ